MKQKPRTSKILKKTKKGGCAPLPRACKATQKQHCGAGNIQRWLLSRQRFCGASPLQGALAMVQRVTYSLFTTAGEQSHIVPAMLEKAIHRSTAAQWAKSVRCFGTRRRPRLLWPQR